MQKECFATINKLHKYTAIVITKPHKGSGMVTFFLNKCNYIKKMENILVNPTKFECVGLASSYDICLNCSKLMFYPKMYTNLFVLQTANNHGCTSILKLINWQCHYIQSCLRQVYPNKH